MPTGPESASVEEVSGPVSTMRALRQEVAAAALYTNCSTFPK